MYFMLLQVIVHQGSYSGTLMDNDLVTNKFSNIVYIDQVMIYRYSELCINYLVLFALHYMYSNIQGVAYVPIEIW